MTDQLKQDVRKAVEDVLKERDEVAIRQETEDALLKSAEKITKLKLSTFSNVQKRIEGLYISNTF